MTIEREQARRRPAITSGGGVAGTRSHTSAEIQTCFSEAPGIAGSALDESGRECLMSKKMSTQIEAHAFR